MPCAVIFRTFRPKPLAKTQQLESESQIGWGVPKAVKTLLGKMMLFNQIGFTNKPQESFTRPQMYLKSKNSPFNFLNMRSTWNPGRGGFTSSCHPFPWQRVALAQVQLLLPAHPQPEPLLSPGLWFGFRLHGWLGVRLRGCFALRQRDRLGTGLQGKWLLYP